MINCDKCDQGRFRPRYRRGKPPAFYCDRCGRKKPDPCSIEKSGEAISGNRVELMICDDPLDDRIEELTGVDREAAINIWKRSGLAGIGVVSCPFETTP